MLTLTRRVNEKIYIGNDIVVTVCRIDSGIEGVANTVKIGIEAPRETLILRSELRERMIRKPNHKKAEPDLGG